MTALKTKTVLVTGAGGFIGGHMVGELLKMGFRVSAADKKPLEDWFQLHTSAKNMSLDLSTAGNCLTAVRGAEEVYHFAADMGGIGFIERKRVECLLNILIDTHLFQAASALGVKKLFYASSACVYNTDLQRNSDVTALKESDALPALPEEGYGWEKLFAEQMLKHYGLERGLGIRIGRFHNVYGPHGTPDLEREKAPSAICRKVADAVSRGKHEIQIWGDGEQTRSFTYIDDALEAVVRLMKSDVTEPVNVGSSELVSIDELVTIVEEIAGVRLERNYSPHSPKGVRGRNSDNSFIQERLGWQPSISLRAGLE
ncbi:MAG: NAD-dependent epimerase/dehydratase family protein, partial [Bdellovibrionia bacterium]